ncbi:hypothetical protein NYP20_02995 [Pseudomonas sp. N3-W]|uniref:hypothetical protein n=1 Tax=Pseudomonas sp. N3-W TaxID=2975049 RepID=UPI00217CD804|nr:hypothetical protein [Pseudomonas sp. N3-W]UWF49950.1 hypothetical protein NYP20_02995 [Pseudomonas sp. N3-W]
MTAHYDAYLVSGNLTIFCGTQTDDFKSDILNSSLLAELLATKTSNDREVSWPTYTETVQKIAWVSKSRTMQRTEFSYTTLLNTVIQCAGSALPNPERQTLANAFSELKNLPVDSVLIKTITDKLKANASPYMGATAGVMTGVPFQTTMLLTIVRSDKTLLTLQIAFKTTDATASSILGQPVLNAIKNGKTNMHLLCSSLDGRQSNLVRNEVIKKLGSKIETDLLRIQAPTC